ncbi:UNVERIFIED_CONTAM: hypothetical protein PYX00_006410 [Menopon gallinae]|uniref:Pro-resilin n=1 Tax=Menopon gallinae TaxID=328185 RepID=A0AAW2HX49_9NEOP
MLQEPAHYEFHYNIHDPHHGTEFGHKEYRDGHVAKGQYIVLLPDGRRQIVDYIADAHGYRPTIRYETGFGYR